MSWLSENHGNGGLNPDAFVGVPACILPGGQMTAGMAEIYQEAYRRAVEQHGHSAHSSISGRSLSEIIARQMADPRLN